MSRLRLQASPCNTGQRAWYTVNLDGVPLGCQDDLRGDPALVIIVESEVAKIPHRFRERIDGAMLFLEKDRHRAAKKAALWEEIADQREKELATLRAQLDELWKQLTPLKDAVLFARSQRRPMGIGQDSPLAPACVSIQLGAEYGRERDNAGFWIESDEIAHTDADSPSPCRRIALALIRLAYSVAEKVKPPR